MYCHSSEIRGLCSKKCSSKNFKFCYIFCIWKLMFLFRFSFCATFCWAQTSFFLRSVVVIIHLPLIFFQFFDMWSLISFHISFEVGLIYAMSLNDQALMVLNKMHIILLFNVVLSTMAFSIMGEGNNKTNVCIWKHWGLKIRKKCNFARIFLG